MQCQKKFMQLIEFPLQIFAMQPASGPLRGTVGQHCCIFLINPSISGLQKFVKFHNIFTISTRLFQG
jgi:hypothetical protein